MLDLGTTSHIIVAGLLAIGQLIEPVPDNIVKEKAAYYQNSTSCSDFKKKERDFKKKKCERIRKNKRKFKKVCAPIEQEMNGFEVKCATDPTALDVIAYKPKPLDSYFKMSNADLITELNLICSAVQDRAFLDRKEWLSGEVANRDDMASKMVAFKKPELQDLAKTIVLEAKTEQFKMADAHKVLLALCHWKVDRKEVAKRIDFTKGLKYLRQLMQELPDVKKLPELKQANFILNNKRERIGEVFDREYVLRGGKKLLKKVHRRRTVGVDEIPDIVFDAFSAIEDKRFKTHNGFDFEALKRLYYSGSQGSNQGGSTFTMQIIKNAFFAGDVEKERSVGLRTIKRKIKEILTIPLVENQYTKKEILTYYLNLIDFLPKSQGIKMAAADLFGRKDLHKLKLEEIAMLAALPKGSSVYNPRRFPERAKLRRDTVLRVMSEQGLITSAQKEEVQARPLTLVDIHKKHADRVQARHFTGHLIDHFLKLKKENTHDDRWSKGGLDVLTSLDSAFQKKVNIAVQKNLLNYEKSRGRYKYQAWLDSNSGLNLNISNLVEKFKGDWVRAVNSKKAAHPYPETEWLVATKMPSEKVWGLETGKTVSVAKSDSSIYRSLKAYDMVLLEPQKNKDGEVVSYKLSSGSRAQASAVVMDVRSGEVLALTGGFTAGPYGKFAQNNRATRSLRQPGSTVKPFTYLYALNQGFQPNVMLANHKITFPQIPKCGYTWSPKNYSGGGGSLTMVRALERSVNRSFVNLFLKLTGVPHNQNGGNNLAGASQAEVNQINKTFLSVYDFAANLGAYPQRQDLKRLKRNKPCLPLLIGGYETTVLNMTQAYASIANGGLKRPAVFLNEVLKGEQPLVVNKAKERKREVDQYRYALEKGLVRVPEAFGVLEGLKPQAVTQVRSIMEGIVKRGTARRISKWSGLVAGKTGTTNKSKDVWFAGFNNNIAVVVWVGYDDTKFYPNLGGSSTGSSLALPVFESIMEVYYDYHPEELKNFFPKPENTPGLVKQKVSLSSGRVVEDYKGNKCGSVSGADEMYFSKEEVDFRPKLTCGKN